MRCITIFMVVEKEKSSCNKMTFNMVMGKRLCNTEIENTKYFVYTFF